MIELNVIERDALVVSFRLIANSVRFADLITSDGNEFAHLFCPIWFWDVLFGRYLRIKVL